MTSELMGFREAACDEKGVPFPEYTQAMLEWLALCDEFPVLVGHRAIANEPPIPLPLPHAFFQAFIGTLLREPYRSILQHVLFEMLKDGVKIVVSNASEGGGN